MQYLILIYANEQGWSSMNDAQKQQSFAAFMEYNKQLAQAGVLRGGSQLHPSRAAKTLRIKENKPVISDGPFAESKEQLGGTYLVEVGSEADALSWAARCPAAQYGAAIEVRMVVEQT